MDVEVKDLRRSLIGRRKSVSYVITLALWSIYGYFAWTNGGWTRAALIALLTISVISYVRAPAMQRALYRRYMIADRFQERVMAMEAPRDQVEQYLNEAMLITTPGTYGIDRDAFYLGVGYGVSEAKRQLDKAAREVDDL
jgi:hypothetical protein